MNTTGRLAALFFAASFLIALGMQGLELGHVPWYLSRASGLVAYVVLSGSVCFGLLISSKAADGLLKRPLVFEVHQFLSVIVLSLLGLHAGALLFDGFLRFTPGAILVPFAGPYRPFWVGLGVLAAWSIAALTASFWMRRQIGQRGWRRLHYLSFGAWVLSLVHGFAAGTDTQLPFVFWVYVLSAAAVAGLLTYRVGVTLAPQARAPIKPSRDARSGAAR